MTFLSGSLQAIQVELDARDKAQTMFDVDDVLKLCGDLQRVGLCIDCGHEQDGVGPHSERVVCEDCGEPCVYGAEACLTLMED